MTEHLPADELLGQLVDRRGAELVARAEALDQGDPVRERAEAVRVGVAEVDAERVPAVRVDRGGETVGGEVERLVPADPLPARLAGGRVDDPADGASQPVGVVVHVGDRDALGTDVPARQRVVGVAAHPGDPAVGQGELQGRRSPRRGCRRRAWSRCAEPCPHPRTRRFHLPDRWGRGWCGRWHCGGNHIARRPHEDHSAAVVYEAGKPIEIEELELDGPQGRRGAHPLHPRRAVPLRRARRARRPGGPAADGARPRGRGHHRGGRPGRDPGQGRRPRGLLVHPELRHLSLLRQRPAVDLRHGRDHPRGLPAGRAVPDHRARAATTARCACSARSASTA